MKKQKQCEHCGAKGELRKDLPRAKTLTTFCSILKIELQDYS